MPPHMHGSIIFLRQRRTKRACRQRMCYNCSIRTKQILNLRMCEGILINYNESVSFIIAYPAEKSNLPHRVACKDAAKHSIMKLYDFV